MEKAYRVAVIGATGRGDYGHGLDTAFQNVKRAKIVAVADPHEQGRLRAGQKLGIDKKHLHSDYRQMLAREKPDIVCIGPRWVTDRVAMVEAVAEAGAHIYCEKPLVGDLESMDRILAACSKARVRMAMAHQWRAAPPVQQAIRDVRAGKYGRLLRIHVRPKDDSRGGGEELLVHGSHLFDLMIAFAGLPRWAAAHISTGGRDVTRGDARQGTEPIGPIAGDSISAMYGFDHGVRGYFDSTRGLSGTPKSPFDSVYGLALECERARLVLRQPGDVYFYPAPLPLPDLEQLRWEKKWVPEWHFTAEHQPRPLRKIWLAEGNQILANDLIDAIERQREPLSSVEKVRYVIELVQATYASHLAEGRRVPIPLAERQHPLAPTI